MEKGFFQIKKGHNSRQKKPRKHSNFYVNFCLKFIEDNMKTIRKNLKNCMNESHLLQTKYFENREFPILNCREIDTMN